MFLDSKDDGIGAKKDVKDALASVTITRLGKPSVATEKVVEGSMGCKNESGHLSEHDKCRCPQTPPRLDVWRRVGVQIHPRVSTQAIAFPHAVEFFLVASVRCESAEVHEVGS